MYDRENQRTSAAVGAGAGCEAAQPARSLDDCAKARAAQCKDIEGVYPPRMVVELRQRRTELAMQVAALEGRLVVIDAILDVFNY